jgi:hypothetical protein
MVKGLGLGFRRGLAVAGILVSAAGGVLVVSCSSLEWGQRGITHRCTRCDAGTAPHAALHAAR